METIWYMLYLMGKSVDKKIVKLFPLKKGHPSYKATFLQKGWSYKTRTIVYEK